MRGSTQGFCMGSMEGHFEGQHGKIWKGSSHLVASLQTRNVRQYIQGMSDNTDYRLPHQQSPLEVLP